jgi:hypothetical protein
MAEYKLLRIVAGIWVFFGVIGTSIAVYRGYPYWLCALIGMPLGPVFLVVAFLLPPVGEGRLRAAKDAHVEREVSEASYTLPCPKCGRQNSVATRICPRCNHRYA